MEISTLITIILPVITAFVGWFTGSRKRRNDAINELQTTIDNLIKRNNDYLNQLIEIRGQYAAIKSKMEEIQSENEQLKKIIEALKEQLTNVKIITRKI